MGICPHVIEYIQPGNIGKVNVDECEILLPFLRRCDGGAAIDNVIDAIMLLFKQRLQNFALNFIVFNQENSRTAGGHCPSKANSISAGQIYVRDSKSRASNDWFTVCIATR